MERSYLSQFLTILRKRQGFSASYVAEKMKMPIVKFVLLEEKPEIAAMEVIYQLLNILKVSETEYLDFSTLINLMNDEILAQIQSPVAKQKVEVEASKNQAQSILDLFASRDMNVAPSASKKEDGTC